MKHRDKGTGYCLSVLKSRSGNVPIDVIACFFNEIQKARFIVEQVVFAIEEQT